jgi:hypothetical protein
MTSPLHAQIGLKKLGQSTMNFLQVSLSPKGSALGDAYTAVGTGADAIFYNPAGLAEYEGKFDVIFNTTQWIADITYMAGAFAYKTDVYGSIGISFLSVDYGDIYATSLLDAETAATHPDGYIDNDKMDNVGAYAIGLTYAKFISDKFLMGGSIRYVGQQLGESVVASGSKTNEENKLAVDFGLKYYVGFKSARFGVSIRNFGTAVKYEEVSAQLPLVFVLGAAMDLMDFAGSEISKSNSLLLAADFSHPNNYTERVSVGLEYSYKNFFSLRGGYQSNLDFGGLSAGFGLMSPEFLGKNAEFNYSFSQFDIFDNVNRFSLSFSF